MVPARPVSSARPRWRRRLIVAGLVFVALIGAYAAGTLYTRRPAFCNVCHEMSPYYDAWASGPHTQVACVQCHVDPGPIADVMHKPYELREVWLHFTTDPTFPLAGGIELPNERCLGCHAGPIDPEIEGFDHDVHSEGRACKTCHGSTGHAVTASALSAAGVLNAEAQAQLDAERALTVGARVPLAGHAVVSCSDCHDMSAAGCSACHEPPAAHYGPGCAQCHTPGAPWESASFTHPRIEGGEHTYRSFGCEKCHPSGYASANCTCHGGNPPTEDD